MADKPSEVDPQTLDDLRVVEQACRSFGACGMRAEFWELFTLLKVGRDAFQAETARLELLRQENGAATVDRPILNALMSIKAQLGPLARQLREFLGRMPGVMDGMKQDLGLVFLMGSAHARQAVTRWVTDPQATAGEAHLKLKILSRLVDLYRAALLESRRDATPVTGLPKPLKKDETEVRAVSSTARIKPEFVEDLRRLDRCREFLQDASSWDLPCLILLRREETRRSIADMEHLKVYGKPGELAGETYRLRQALRDLHNQHDGLVMPLLSYAGRLYGTWGGPTDDLALAFLIASSQGRHRARQWLDDPELCKGEATATINGLRGRAATYLDAAKHMPATSRQQSAAGSP